MLDNISASIMAPTGTRRISMGWDAGARSPSHQIVLASDFSLRSKPRISFAEHISNYGRLPIGLSLQVAIDTVRAANLRGRGGAYFSFARKLEAVARANSRKAPVIVANGSESEPLSKKDTFLLRTNPHLVLDGMAIMGSVLGSKNGYLYVGDKEAALSIGAAIRERRDRGTEELKVVVVEAPPGYLSGQESAVVQRIERGPAFPQRSSERVAVCGVKGVPTLLSNVETFAQIALIMRFGADWYRSVGSGSDPGTRLVTIVGSVDRPGVYEIAPGIRLSSVLREAGAAQARAVLIGGYFGGWINASTVLSLDFGMDDVSLGERRLSFGAGVIGVLSKDTCPVVEAAGMVEYLAGQSSGQCAPCINGLPEISTSFARIALSSNVSRGLAELRNVIPLVEGQGGCQHPDGVIGLVRSTVNNFGDELRLHKSGKCSALGSHRSVLLPASNAVVGFATAGQN